MSDDRRLQLQKLLESGQAQLHPLSLPQRELWETNAVPPTAVSNHICAFIEVRGVIAEEDCTAALQAVVDRQEVLRLSFLPGKTGPLQMIRSTGTAAVQYRDLTTEQCQPEVLEALMMEIFAKPFDFARGPLYRVEMLRRAPNDLLLVFAMHHSIGDGWSLGVFVQDLAAAYFERLRRKGQARALPPVPQSHTEWSAAERAFWQPAEVQSRSAFWKQLLAGHRHAFAPLPLAESGQAGSARPRRLLRWATAIDEDLTRDIRELAKRNGTTLFSTLLAGFQLAMARWRGVEDVVVGTPVANRNKQNSRETMGYFAGNVPLRLKLSDGDKKGSFQKHHQTLHHQTLDAFAHAMPFAELVKALEVKPAAGEDAIYQVRFALQNHPVPDITVPGLSLKLRMRSTGTARFVLGCEVTEDGKELEVVWLYEAAHFSVEDIKELDAHFSQVLATAGNAPGISIETILQDQAILASTSA